MLGVVIILNGVLIFLANVIVRDISGYEGSKGREKCLEFWIFDEFFATDVLATIAWSWRTFVDGQRRDFTTTFINKKLLALRSNVTISATVVTVLKLGPIFKSNMRLALEVCSKAGLVVVLVCRHCTERRFLMGIHTNMTNPFPLLCNNELLILLFKVNQC